MDRSRNKWRRLLPALLGGVLVAVIIGAMGALHGYVDRRMTHGRNRHTGIAMYTHAFDFFRQELQEPLPGSLQELEETYNARPDAHGTLPHFVDYPAPFYQPPPRMESDELFIVLVENADLVRYDSDRAVVFAKSSGEVVEIRWVSTDEIADLIFEDNSRRRQAMARANVGG
jgi:hypothetical protein